MSMEYIENNINKFILNDYMSESQYHIALNESSLSKDWTSSSILVNSRREIELLLLCLGNEVNVVMDEQARFEHQDIWEWLYGRTYDEILKDLHWSYKEDGELLELIDRIPISKMINDNIIQSDNKDLKVQQAEPWIVHKIHKDNVLISEPYNCGNMIYFQGLKKSKEFQIDHSSDHLEGIIIFEVARQSGIASVHIAGVPPEGTIVILKSQTNYTKFVEINKPYIIRTIPVIKERGGYSYCIYNILQDGHSCATGYFSGMVFRNKKSYERLFGRSKVTNMISNENVVNY